MKKDSLCKLNQSTTTFSLSITTGSSEIYTFDDCQAHFLTEATAAVKSKTNVDF